MMSGKYPGVLSLGWGFVDVRDVAKAHILGLTNNSAKGRYLCCNKTMLMNDVVDLLREKYGKGYPLPTTKLNCAMGDTLVKLTSYFQDAGTASYLRTNVGKVPKFDNSKVQKLGVEFIDLQKTIFDTVEDLITKGHLPDLRAKTSSEDKELLDNLLKDMKDPTKGVEVKDRKYHLKTYPQCFVGSEAVDWLVKHASLKHRLSAVNLGQQLMNMGAFSHVKDRHDFADEGYFYKFA